MERLHPPVQHLRESRQLRDLPDREARLAEELRGPACRDQLGAMPRDRPGKLQDSGLVVNADHGPLNLAHDRTLSPSRMMTRRPLIASRPSAKSWMARG